MLRLRKSLVFGLVIITALIGWTASASAQVLVNKYVRMNMEPSMH